MIGGKETENANNPTKAKEHEFIMCNFALLDVVR